MPVAQRLNVLGLLLVVFFFESAHTEPVATAAVGHQQPITDLVLSPDGHYLLSEGADDGVIKLWDVAGRREVASYQFADSHGERHGAVLMSFSADGHRLLLDDPGSLTDPPESGTGGDVPPTADHSTSGIHILHGKNIVDAASGELIVNGPSSTPLHSYGSAAELRTSGDRPMIVDSWTGESISMLPEVPGVRPVALSEDRTTLLTVSTSSSTTSGVTASRKSVMSHILEAAGDALLLASAVVPGVSLLHGADSLRGALAAESAADQAFDLSIGAAGAYVASSVTDILPEPRQTVLTEVQVWSLKKQRPTRRVRIKKMVMDSSVAPALSPDGHLLAVQPSSDSLRIYDLTAGKGQMIKLNPAVKRHAAGFIFSPDGRYLAVRSGPTPEESATSNATGESRGRGTLTVYDARNGSVVCQPVLRAGDDEFSARLERLSFNRDGTLLALNAQTPNGSDGRRVDGVEMWHLPDGTAVDVRATSVAFSADGHTVALGLPSGAPALLDVTSGISTPIAEVAAVGR